MTQYMLATAKGYLRVQGLTDCHLILRIGSTSVLSLEPQALQEFTEISKTSIGIFDPDQISERLRSELWILNPP